MPIQIGIWLVYDWYILVYELNNGGRRVSKCGFWLHCWGEKNLWFASRNASKPQTSLHAKSCMCTLWSGNKVHGKQCSNISNSDLQKSKWDNQMKNKRTRLHTETVDPPQPVGVVPGSAEVSSVAQAVLLPGHVPQTMCWVSVGWEAWPGRKLWKYLPAQSVGAAPPWQYLSFLEARAHLLSMLLSSFLLLFC